MPPPGGYPPAGGPGASPYGIGAAFSWAFNKFGKNAVALIVATLVFGVIVSLLEGIVYWLATALSPDAVTSYESYDSGFAWSSNVSLSPGGLVVAIFGSILLWIVIGAIASAYIAGVLDIANGRPVEVGSFFKPRNVGSVVIASLIVGILTSIGYALCVIPGIIVAVFAMFTYVAIIERNLSPIDGIKASFEISKANFGQAFLAWLLMVVTIFVGALLCGVGLLVAVPVATLFLVYTYRRLSGGDVAPMTP
jgi:uncharacterized membrane protein